jgi:hypothetical protein
MATKRNIRLRIARQRLELLLHLCQEVQPTYTGGNEHAQLLGAYLNSLSNKLAAMLDKEQDNYTLMLLGHEAVAFSQIWQQQDLSHDMYANIVIDNILKKVDAAAA